MPTTLSTLKKPRATIGRLRWAGEKEIIALLELGKNLTRPLKVHEVSLMHRLTSGFKGRTTKARTRVKAQAEGLDLGGNTWESHGTLEDPLNLVGVSFGSASEMDLFFQFVAESPHKLVVTKFLTAHEKFLESALYQKFLAEKKKRKRDTTVTLESDSDSEETEEDQAPVTPEKEAGKKVILSPEEFQAYYWYKNGKTEE